MVASLANADTFDYRRYDCCHSEVTVVYRQQSWWYMMGSLDCIGLQRQGQILAGGQ